MEVGKRLSSGITNVWATNSCFSLYLQIKSFVVQLLTKVLHAQKEKIGTTFTVSYIIYRKKVRKVPERL